MAVLVDSLRFFFPAGDIEPDGFIDRLAAGRVLPFVLVNRDAEFGHSLAVWGVAHFGFFCELTGDFDILGITKCY